LLIRIAETSPKLKQTLPEKISIFLEVGGVASQNLGARIAETSPKRVDSTWKKESAYF
jgi:hypothetical protein